MSTIATYKLTHKNLKAFSSQYSAFAPLILYLENRRELQKSSDIYDIAKGIKSAHNNIDPFKSDLNIMEFFKHLEHLGVGTLKEKTFTWEVERTDLIKCFKNEISEILVTRGPSPLVTMNINTELINLVAMLPHYLTLKIIPHDNGYIPLVLPINLSKDEYDTVISSLKALADNPSENYEQVIIGTINKKRN